jgi:hypothetical protein
LPRMTTQVRGPYGWWDPQDKRNFGEDVIWKWRMNSRIELLTKKKTNFFFQQFAIS